MTELWDTSQERGYGGDVKPEARRFQSRKFGVCNTEPGRETMEKN